MTLEGRPQSEIAVALGCSQPAVSAHQRALAEAWRQTAAAEVAQHRARVLAELAAVREQAWRAWFASLDTGKADAALLRAITAAAVEAFKATGGAEAAPEPAHKALWIVPPEMPLDEWMREAQKLMHSNDGNTPCNR
jgi:hypothetical protein